MTMLRVDDLHAWYGKSHVLQGVRFSVHPGEIVALRQRLGFDFGKFDYVLHQGRSYLLDVNRTPAFGHSPARLRRQGEVLAAGLHGLLRD